MASRDVVITGATGALGAAVVERLLEDGARCHVTWRVPAELARFPYADRVTLHEVDCSDEARVAAFYAGLPGLDASLHLVGGFAMAPVTETPASELARLWQMNVLTAFLCCREAVVALRKHGRGGQLVNVSARPALEPTGGMVAYSAAKAAVASLTRSLGAELRDERILVNAVAPSVIDTPANRRAMPDADHARWPTPREVADAIAFLAGPTNRLTSGCVLPVYGRA